MDYFSSDKLVVPERGDLLISEPYLQDPNFDRTVILICEHDNDSGTFGLVLNRLSDYNLSEILTDAQATLPVFVGGPVEMNTLHFIHRDGSLVADSHEVHNGIFWGGNLDEALEKTNLGLLKQSDIHFFIGYSGWSPGQLMDELRAKAWIVYKGATAEMIFDWDNQALWKACLSHMGGKYKLMSNYPSDPRLN